MVNNEVVHRRQAQVHDDQNGAITHVTVTTKNSKELQDLARSKLGSLTVVFPMEEILLFRSASNRSTAAAACFLNTICF